MELRDALAVLGLGPDPSWDDVRRSFRNGIREVHPDVTGDDPAARRRAVELNLAYQTIEQATAGGTRQLEVPAPDPQDLDAPQLVLHAPAGEVFVLLLDAADRLGEVSYVDATEGLLQVLVREGGGPLCQLVAAIDGPRVTFTLEPLTAGDAPPIRTVVERLARLLADGQA